MSKVPGKLSNPVKASELLDAHRIMRDRFADNIVAALYYDKYHSDWQVFFIRVQRLPGIPETFGEVVGMCGFSTYGSGLRERQAYIRGLMREYAELA